MFRSLPKCSIHNYSWAATVTCFPNKGNSKRYAAIISRNRHFVQAIILNKFVPKKIPMLKRINNLLHFLTSSTKLLADRRTNHTSYEAYER